MLKAGSRLLWPALLLLFGAAVSFGLENPQELLRRVDEHYLRVTSLKAEFVQKEKVAAMGGVRESRGTLLLKRPGKMRWDYAAPEKQTIVTEGRTIYVYYPEEKSVYPMTFGPAELERTPLAILFQEKMSLRDYFRGAAAAGAGDNLARLDLQPLGQGKEASSVSLLVRVSDGAIMGTVIKDTFGNLTEINLTKVEEGARIDESSFSFRIPPGTRVIQSGERR